MFLNKEMMKYLGSRSHWTRFLIVSTNTRPCRNSNLQSNNVQYRVIKISIGKITQPRNVGDFLNFDYMLPGMVSAILCDKDPFLNVPHF